MARRKGSGRAGVSVSTLGEAAQRQVMAFLFAEREQARLRGLAKPEEPKRSKYGAKPTVVDGITFASALEARRWVVLRQRQRLGLIRDLERQPRFPLIVEGALVTTYVADFRYRDAAGRTVIEDAKGYKTPAYKIKKRLFEALNKNLEIAEVTSCRM